MSGLTLILLTVASPIPAAAQDPGLQQVQMYLTASPWRSLDDLCVGDRAYMDVTANRLLGRRPGHDHMTNPPVQVFGVAITATASDPSVGTLFPAVPQRTWARGTPPGSARFTFTPMKPGTTTLTFRGTHGWFGQDEYLATELAVTVKECVVDNNFAMGNLSGWADISVKPAKPE